MTLANIDLPPTQSPVIRCEPRYGALICLDCKSAFPVTKISRHFSSHHHYPVGLRRQILESSRQDTLAQDWNDLKYPADGTAPIEGLTIKYGYACVRCGVKTIGDNTVKVHSKCGEHVTRVYLQRWNKIGAPKYWTVTVPGGVIPSVTKNVPCGTFQFLHWFNGIEPSVIHKTLLQQDNQRERQERDQRIEPNNSDDTSPWLQFMQWDKTFRGKDISVREYD